MKYGWGRRGCEFIETQFRFFGDSREDTFFYKSVQLVSK
jgi:hypothetical protein